MKNFFKDRKVLSGIILATFFLFVGGFIFFQIVYAATTVTNNQAPAQKVTANEADFLVLDFTLNVASDTTLAGSATGGTAITATKPADWTTTKFYDATGGGAWSSGSDWIGTGRTDYYQLAATPLSCPDENTPYVNRPDLCETSVRNNTPNGLSGFGDDKLRYLPNESHGSYICTNSFTNPTFIYRANSSSCEILACDIEHRQDCYILGLDDDAWNVGPSGYVSNAIAQQYGWIYHDAFEMPMVGYGNYEYYQENLFIIPSAYRTIDNATIFYENSVTLAGTTPPSVTGQSPTSVTGTKPADWTSVKFYDSVAGGVWDAGADWIGLDTDSNGIYADKLHALTADLHEDATISPANVSNVKFYAGTPGSGSHLGTATSYDGGGSGWYLSGLNRALSAGSNRFYVTMSLSGATNNDRVRMKVPRTDLNSDGLFNIGDAGIFLASRVLGDFANTAYMTVDTIPPTLTITMDDNEFAIGDTTTVTFEFSEEVTGFTAGDITVGNGALSNFTTSDDITWTATYTPINNLDYVGINAISVDMTGLTDVAGNLGLGTQNSANYEVDTKRPTLLSARFSSSDDAKIQIGDTPTITFTFSEEVSGFTLEDAITSVANGELSNLQTLDNIIYTATITPTESVDYMASNKIVVDMSVVEDNSLSTKSNFGLLTADSDNYEVDTLRPTLISAEFANDDMLVGENSSVTFVFSEKVIGFDPVDLTVLNGAIGPISSLDDGITWTTIFTPTIDTEALENVIEIDLTGIRDKRLDPLGLKGNSGEGTDESENYAIDTLRPTLEITIDDDALLIGEVAIVTFTFSEEVSGFNLDDDTETPNGNWDEEYGLQTEEGVDHNRVYTAKLVPNDDVDYDETNVITVDMTGVVDVNIEPGNTGEGNEESLNYEVDTTRPTVEIGIDDAGLLIGETAEITFTFSEEVFGLDLENVSVENGSWCEVYGLQTLDNIEYTAKLIPDGDIDYDDTNRITVDMTGVVDVNIAPGNHGAGVDGDNTHSPNYEVDTTRPTLEIEMTRDSFNRIQTAVVTFTFSEEVSGFNLLGVGVENGELSDMDTLDNIVYTATFTPDMGVEDDTNVLSFDMSNVADVNILPGNDGEGNVFSLNYTIDTINPTFDMQYYSDSGLTAEIDGGSYLKAGTYYIKITASEELSSAPTISIDAEGTANDVTDDLVVELCGNEYKYVRIISYDENSKGDALEEVRINGTDVAGNVVIAVAPLNEGAKAIYIDTVAPVVNAGADAGTVDSVFTRTGSATDIDGSGIASYAWSKESGYHDVVFGSPNSAETTVTVPGGGPYVIKLSVTDNAGNVGTDTFTFTWGSLPRRRPEEEVSSGGGGGGGGGTTYCSSVTYKSWGDCINGLQIRDVDTKTPLGCTLTAIQQAELERSCVISQEEEDDDEIDTILESVDNESGASPSDLDLESETVSDDDSAGTTTSVSYSFDTNLSYGMSNNDVLALQNILASLGYLTATPNGNFGPSTLAAVRAYQRDNGLPVTGFVGPMTRELLNQYSGVDSATPPAQEERVETIFSSLAERLAGYMLLRVEAGGAIGYVDPRNLLTYHVTWTNAMALFEARALGINETNHSLIPVYGSDDSTTSTGNRLRGYLLLRVEEGGAITYVDMNGYGHNITFDNLMHVFESTALGITEADFSRLSIGSLE